MRLCEKLYTVIPSQPHLFVSITGSGGKTALMQKFAAFLKHNGKRVLMTTTVRIQNSSCYKWDTDIVFTDSESALSFFPDKPVAVLYGETGSDSAKLYSPSEKVLETLKQRYDIVLCEADGSRHLPLKIHTEKDPVIMPFNDYTITVVGAWAAGYKAKDVVFGSESEEIVDEKYVQYLANDSQGILKGCEDDKSAVLINCTKPSQVIIFSSMQWKKKCVILPCTIEEDELLN